MHYTANKMQPAESKKTTRSQKKRRSQMHSRFQPETVTLYVRDCPEFELCVWCDKSPRVLLSGADDILYAEQRGRKSTFEVQFSTVEQLKDFSERLFNSAELRLEATNCHILHIEYTKNVDFDAVATVLVGAQPVLSFRVSNAVLLCFEQENELKTAANGFTRLKNVVYGSAVRTRNPQPFMLRCTAEEVSVLPVQQAASEAISGPKMEQKQVLARQE